jgi:hypothetical protein
MMSDRVLKDIKGTKPVYNKPYKKHKWYQFWKPIANAIYKIYYNVVLVPVQYAKNTIPVGSRLLKENAQFL